MRPPLAPSIMRYPEGPPMGYGYRGNIGVPGASTFHEGIDIAVPTGTPVYAIADGRVVLTTDSGAPGISILYQIDSTTRIRCNHFSRRYYSRGQSFREGQVIGLSGNTGASGGPHLHVSVFKLRNGHYKSIDPTPWLRTMLAGTSGTEEDDMTPEQAKQLNSIYAAIFVGGSSMKDSKRSISASLADIVKKVGPINRDDKQISLRQEVADAKTTALQLTAQVAALTNLVEQIASGTAQIDMGAVEAAAAAGAREALAGLTLTATVPEE